MKKIIILFIALFLSFPLMAEEAKPESKLAKPVDEVLKVTDQDKVLGQKQAPVVIIEYASLSCPHCKSFSDNVLPKIEEKYIKSGRVKYIYRHFPLNGPALKAALLTECVPIDQYYTYIKALFDSQGKWAFSLDSEGNIKNIARLGGMPDEEFDACMKNKKLSEKIADTRLDAENSLKITSTPTIYINNKAVEGSRDFESMAKLIDAELEKK